MARAFVDSSAWLAMIDKDDPKQAVMEAWFGAGGRRLVTTSDVLDETVTFAQAKWGHRVAVALGTAIKENPEVHMVHVEPEFQEEAWNLFKARADKRFSLTDCTSLVIMKRLDLVEVATLDGDFAQEGFRVVP